MGFFDTPDVQINYFDWAHMASLFFRAREMTECVRIFQKAPIKITKQNFLQPVQF